MNVFRLKEIFEMLIKEGQGDKEVTAFDPDADDWMPITHFIYSTTKSVRLYTEDIS